VGREDRSDCGTAGVYLSDGEWSEQCLFPRFLNVSISKWRATCSGKLKFFKNLYTSK